MAQQGHWQDVYVNLIPQSLFWDLMETPYIRYSNVVDQDRDIESFKLTVKVRKEMLTVALGEIRNNKLGLDLMQFVILSYFCKSCLHFA